MRSMIWGAFLSLALPLASVQTVAEKIESSSLKGEEDVNFDLLLSGVNEGLKNCRVELAQCLQEASLLEASGAEEGAFCSLLERVKEIRTKRAALEEKFHAASLDDSKRDEEGYAVWDQEETTLSQLIVEFGALDYLYVIPPEMAGMKLSMHSNIPIPREAWGDVLGIILAHNGVGVKQVNPYTKQLYVLKQDPSAIEHIASSPDDLLWMGEQSRVFYVFSPPVEQVKSVFQFFERFADAKQTFVYQVGPKIAIVSSKEEVEKLLSLHQTVWKGAKGKVSKVVSISKMGVKEMEKILQSFFGEAVEKGRPPFGKPEQEGLSIFSLGQGNALVLIGQEEVVERAEKIVKDTEEQLQDPAEMTVYLYSCRNSNPEDLAKVLEKVYASLLLAPSEGQKEAEVTVTSPGAQYKTPEGYAPTPPLVVSPNAVKPAGQTVVEAELGSDHFIPDLKTGNLLMVVRRDALAKIKELLRKMDVPKKMVHIEVMLFEKRYHNQNSFGINMLKLGSNKTSVQFDSKVSPSLHGSGVLAFLLNRTETAHLPAYDLAYSFLMTQEDIQLNAAPSVTTVNQTVATISIVEELSINNGAAPVNTSSGNIAFEKSFSRAQYGIVINMTPTVHLSDEEASEKGSVTLKTDVTFDTTKNDANDRPLVDRRHIQNEVRVSDGETIILGGLRRKAAHDTEERIPFLGEIPGLGKFFGSTKLTSNNTEMFFFITPKIVKDPGEELLLIREEEMKKRPGDIPEFLQRLNDCLDKERKKFFVNSIEMFFGR